MKALQVVLFSSPADVLFRKMSFVQAVFEESFTIASPNLVPRFNSVLSGERKQKQNRFAEIERLVENPACLVSP